MATLQKIRNKAGFLVTVIGLAMLAFILGDLMTSGRTIFNKVKDKAFEVNGEVISTEEYFNRVTEWENFQKIVSGQTSLDENATSQIRELVYQQMVREKMLDAQAKKLGLSVSKEEVNDLVHGETISPLLQQLPLFVNPETGVYDRNTLMNFLNTINQPVQSLKPEERALVEQYKQVWLFVENLIKYQRLEEKFTALLSGAVMTNDVEAKKWFEWSQTNADLTYVVQNYYTIPDSTVKVTDDEIRKFYENHKKNFKLPVPVAKLTYFTREISPSDADFAEVEKQAKEAAQKLKETENPAAIVADYSEAPYKDAFVAANALTPSQLSFASTANIGDVYGPVREENSYQIYKLIDKTVAPDSVHLRLIVIPDRNTMGKDTTVTHFVDSIYNVIQNGKPFAEVANSLSPQSKGGDAGWAREIDLVQLGKEFVQAAFTSPVGTLKKISVPGQQIIMQVEERTQPVTKYKLAIINMPVIVSEKTSNNVDNELNQFISNPEVSKKFTQLAAEKGYSVVPNYSASASDLMLGQIPNSRQVINWAINEKKKGAVKKFDLTNLRIIARVDNVIPAGIAPLSEVSTSIRTLLARDKKAEKMINDLKAKKLSGMSDYAQAMNGKIDTVKFVNFNTQNITGLGFEPVLNAFSAYAPLHKVMGPAKGNMGVFVVTVENRTQGNEPYNAKAQKSILNNNTAYRLQMQSMEILKDKLKVKDNRFRFY
jgi:peptidyl-prolyl cis-trans isomerase D